MRTNIHRALFGLALVLAFTTGGTAQTETDPNDGIVRPEPIPTYVYSAKFLCRC